LSERFVLGAPFGRWQTNCYLVGDLDRSRAVLVDPGEGAAEGVPPLIAQLGVEIESILLTHGHIDHLWSVPGLAAELDVPVLLHPDDRWLWDNPGASNGIPLASLPEQFGLRWQPPTERLRDVAHGQSLSLAGVDFTVQHNPGHTPGHVTYLGRSMAGVGITFPLGRAEEASDDLLFSGDLVFAGSIGRTDLARGDTAAIMRSLVETVLPLADDTVILAGHGPDTTVGRERATNPFLGQAAALFGR